MDQKIDLIKAIEITKEFKEKYYKNHSVCPICKTKNFKSSKTSYMIVLKENGEVEPFVDENKVNCICGWIGIIDELT